MTFSFELVNNKIKKMYHDIFPEIGDTLLHTYLVDKHLMICKKDNIYTLYTCSIGVTKLTVSKTTTDIVEIFDYVNEIYDKN